MNRESRKANLKKLQLPSSGSVNTRKLRNSKTTTSISNYFNTPSKEPQDPTLIDTDLPSKVNPAKINKHETAQKRNTNQHSLSANNQHTLDLNINEIEPPLPLIKLPNTSPPPKPPAKSEPIAESKEVKSKRGGGKRTKLTNFVYKDEANIPPHILEKKETPCDDFEIPEKKIKRAPPKPKTTTNKTRTKQRQPNIKSAFLRNEQLFSEITAQHCIADNFSPEDMQLALAISKSEAETSGILCAADVDDEVVELVVGDIAAKEESIRSKLKKYGFRTAVREDYSNIAAAFLPGGTRRKKSKWANKFTPLTLRDPELQKKKVNQKIEALLAQQIKTKPLSDAESHFETNNLISSILRKYQTNNERIFKNCEFLPTTDLEKYFVKDLFAVTTLKSGHLLKDWQAIQGRDLSPTLKTSQCKIREQKLQKVYTDLEQYFGASKKLNFDGLQNFETTTKINCDQTTNKDVNITASVSTSNSLRNASIASENNSSNNGAELDKMLELIVDLSAEHMSSSEGVLDIKTNNTSVTGTTAAVPTSPQKEPPDKKAKMIDETMISPMQSDMQSSTQMSMTRATSPDIFADSDCSAENMEIDNVVETDIISFNKTAQSMTTTLQGISTYEKYSSDEVKTSSSVELVENISTEACLNTLNQTDPIIDLTQEEPSFKEYLTNSITAEEELLSISRQNPMDSDYNSNSQRSKYKDNSIDFTLYKLLNDDDVVLHEMAEDNTSFMNFEGNKQMCSSFHMQTATAAPTDKINNNFKSTAILEALCNKYLKPINNFEECSRRSLSMTQIAEPSGSGSTVSKCNSLTQINKRIEEQYLSSVNLDAKIFKTPTKSRSLTQQHRRSKSTSFILNMEVNNAALNSPFNGSEASIDLTQNDDDEDEDEPDCLMLSDDEINYSIWKADKTNANMHELSLDSNTSTSLAITSNNMADIEYLASPHIATDTNAQDFSFIDLIDEHKSFHEAAVTKKSLTHTMSTINFDGDIEPISSQFLATPYKLDDCATTSTKSYKRALFEERAEFDILESQSETFTESNYNQEAISANEALEDASFLISPTEHSAPMKRYSSSNTQKFNMLLEAVQQPDYDDFDEFDRLIYGSPKQTADVSKSNEPSGLQQLLTAEISFRTDTPTQDYRTPKKLYVSPSSQSKRKSAQILSESPVQHDINGKTYSVRLTTTPKPDYTQQTEAELLKQLYKFGIKPLKRKQAIKMLKYIYNQTHPIIVENEQEDLLTNKVQSQQTPYKISQPTSQISSSQLRNPPVTLTQPSTNLLQAVNFVSKFKLNLQDCCGSTLLRFSQELCAELNNEIYIFQTNVTKKISQALLPLHIAWYNLVCSNTTLHETILMYEPIDLQEIYLFFKSLGYRYDPKDLKIFFDRRCIIFRYDLTAPGKQNENNHHVRKNKKKVSKKTS